MRHPETGGRCGRSFHPPSGTGAQVTFDDEYFMKSLLVAGSVSKFKSNDWSGMSLSITILKEISRNCFKFVGKFSTRRSFLTKFANSE